MNPLTNTRNITNLSKRELTSRNGKTSWHDEYRESAWIFTGGLPYDLSEGDIIAVFSQYGEIVNINLCRDKVTGKQKGFAFICYEDQRSTVLAVDNFNGMKILGRTVRVDHVKDYKPPKDSDKLDDVTRQIMAQGCAPAQALQVDFLLPPPPPREQEEMPTSSRGSLLQIKQEPSSATEEKGTLEVRQKEKEKKRSKKSKKGSSSKSKKNSKHKKEKSNKRKRRRQSSSSESESDSDSGSDKAAEYEDRKRRRKER